MIAKLARFCFRQRRIVLGAWIVLLLAAGTLQANPGSDYKTEFGLPSSESRKGFDVLEKSFGANGGGLNAQFVFQAEQGVDNPAVKAGMETFFAVASKLKGLSVTSPYAPQGGLQIARQGELAGKLAFADVNIAPSVSQQDLIKYRTQLLKAMPKVDGLKVLLGGQAFGAFEPPETELIGLAFAVVILILAFGSVLAMGLPIGTALFGIFVGSGLLAIATQFLSVPDFTPFVGIMIGLGVGIDYALFIITRYRDGLRSGLTYEDATVDAMDSAGRAVLFAGITVIISVLGMWVMGLAFIQGLAVGASVTVLAVLAASMTLLPALLGFAAERINITKRRGVVGSAGLALAFLGLGIKIPVISLVGVALILVAIVTGFFVPWMQKVVPHREEKPLRETIWYRWSRLVQRRPWPMAIMGFVILGLLTAPVFSLRMGFSDEGNFPKETETRKAYDLVAKGFGSGFSSPMVIVAPLTSPAEMAVMNKLQAAVAADEYVAFATPPIPSPDGKAALIRVISKASPQDVKTSVLIDRLRNEVVPEAVEGSNVQAYVAGAGPANKDFSAYLAKRTPIFFGAVLGLSFLLLMIVFRSLLVPLKAVIMNLLSIGASYGIVVAIFQWGWGGSLIGVGQGAPIEPFLPMMLFAIVFGLSMDYEVFLLSRMKEEFDRTRDNASAVADGLAMTARVITAAAAIMVVVFGSFMLEDNRTIKMFGIGLASAVFFDATIVRMLLVPATMELLGAKNWWIPKWLDKIMPRINVEGHHLEAPPAKASVAKA
jgi:putative drug exporter of the RND superfamily